MEPLIPPTDTEPRSVAAPSVSELVNATWTLAALWLLMDAASRDEITGKFTPLPGSREIFDVSAQVLVASRLATVTDGECRLEPHVASAVDAIGSDAFAAHIGATLGQVGSVPQEVDQMAAPDARWAQTPTSVLEAQGRRSALLARVFFDEVLPHFPELAARLVDERCWFLDAGCGTAQLTLAMVAELPNLAAVGLESQSVPYGLAVRNVERAGQSARIEVVRTRVEEFASDREFDLAWLPLDFIAPSSALFAAVERVHTRLGEGGVVFAAAPAPDESLEASCARLRCTLWRGEPLDAGFVEGLMVDIGFRRVGRISLSRGLDMVYAAKGA